MKTRALLAGFFAGILLSAARAPLGLDLTSWPAVRAQDAALFKAAALLVLAVGLGSFGRGGRPSHSMLGLLWGVLAGFAAHGLLATSPLEVESSGGLAALLLAGFAGLLVFGARGAESAEAPTRRTALGLALCGAALSAAFEATARPLRLFGGGLPEDDTVFALALLASIAIGASAFGPFLARPKALAVAPAALFALACASCLASLAFLGSMGEPDSLSHFVREFGIDESLQATLKWDALLGARCFVIPGFLLGAGLFCLKKRGEIASVLAGAAVGALLVPELVERTSSEVSSVIAAMPAQRVAIATSCALAGMVLVLTGPRIGALVRVGCAAFAVVVTWLVWQSPRPTLVPLSPWDKFRPDVRWMRDVPEGLLTVETAPGGALAATLDRRRLTPLAAEERADEIQMRRSMPVGNGDGIRVLWIGQLTPARVRVLQNLGLMWIDRTAPWASSMKKIEELLFEGQPLPQGLLLADRDVERALRLNKHDWSFVYAAPVVGPAPSTEAVRAEDLFEGASVKLVAWIRVTAEPTNRPWTHSAQLAGDGLEHLAIGLQRIGTLPFLAPEPEPATHDVRGEALAPIGRLRMRAFERDHGAIAATTARFEAFVRGLPSETAARAMAMLCAAQTRSSPYETRVQATEIDPQALELLSQHSAQAPKGSLDPLERDLWEYLAGLLADKRELDLLQTHVAPVAAAHAPWPALERALARADHELLDYAHAADRLKVVVDDSPFDLDARLWRAELLLRSDRPKEAAGELRSVLQIQPGRNDAERLLAIALVRAGDPEGRKVTERLLDAGEDAELRAYLGPPPYPALPALPPPGLGATERH